jgi:hypothetical protein
VWFYCDSFPYRQMSSKRKGEKEDSRIAKATHFFLACKQNPASAIQVNILQAMRSWGYSNEETLNRTLQMQVRRAVKALKGEDIAAHPPAANPATATATALLALSGGAMNPVRGVLLNITNIPTAAASIIAVAATAARGGMIDNLSPLTGLPSPIKETHQTSHQAQVDKTNMRKNKDAYNLAFPLSTKIVAEERKKGEGGIQQTTQEVIDQVVEGEFAARGFPLILHRSTINKYVADGRVG